MSKLNKYANLYDKDGNLIRHIDEKTGKLEDYTMEELEALVDKLANDKDENGKVKNPVALNNVNWVLMMYYQKYGNPHLKEWLEKAKASEQKTTEEEFKNKIEEAMNDLKEQELDPNEIVSHVESNLDPEYVDFEEIKE